MSELVSVVYKPKKAERPEEGYLRVPLEKAILVAGYGIEGDEKGSKGGRQLNIMSEEVMRELAGEGFETQPGRMGEQLILAGIQVESLQAGTRLRIGSSACVELTEPRTGCSKFERHQGRPRQEVAGRLGMMARVVAGGPIAIGDSVVLDSSVGD